MCPQLRKDGKLYIIVKEKEEASMVRENTKKMRKRSKLPYLIGFVLILFASIYMLYSIGLLTGIETKIRRLLSFNLFLILLFCLFYIFKVIFHDRKKHILYLLFCLGYSIFLLFGANYIHKTYNVIDQISTNATEYYSSLITLKKNKVDSLSKIETGTIGYLSDSTSIDGNQMPKEIIKAEKMKNKTVEYESYVELLNALLEEKIEYAFVPGNYAIMFSNLDGGHFEHLGEDTKVLYTKEKKIKSENANKGSSLEKPFTILIMGVDSEKESLKGSTFNGDALMLLTFNPTTLNTTILSIPRDSYVPITCFAGQKKNKITHAAWYGADCMMNTISKFLDVKIDYYLKINFKGVVKLIDKLGGIEVDVPYSFCEQDSSRRFGTHTLYVKKGKQTLNGEQALALSRNRKSNANKCSSEWTQGLRNDFVRGQNQQLVLRATLNKIKEVNSLDTLYSLLNTISDNMETNMQTTEMLSLYNVGKDILVKASNMDMEDLIGFQRLYLNGYDDYIYDSGVGKNLYEYILYENSVQAVSDAMKVNLELKKPLLIKEFTFDSSEEYEEFVIGKNVKGNTTTAKIPNVVGLTEKSATTKMKNLGIDVVIRYISEGTGTNGSVLKQSVASGTSASSVQEIILTVFKNN